MPGAMLVFSPTIVDKISHFIWIHSYLLDLTGWGWMDWLVWFALVAFGWVALVWGWLGLVGSLWAGGWGFFSTFVVKKYCKHFSPVRPPPAQRTSAGKPSSSNP